MTRQLGQSRNFALPSRSQPAVFGPASSAWARTPVPTVQLAVSSLVPGARLRGRTVDPSLVISYAQPNRLPPESISGLADICADQPAWAGRVGDGCVYVPRDY